MMVFHPRPKELIRKEPEAVSESMPTPGPWAVSKIGNSYDEWSIYPEGGGSDIAVAVRGKANADLMASVPELLVALKAILEEADYDAEDQSTDLGDRLIIIERTAGDAIARAEGQ